MGAASMCGAFMAKSEIVKGGLLYVAAMTLGIFRAASLGLAVPEMFQASEGASHLSACSGAHSSFHIFRRQLPYPGTAFLRLTM